MARSIAARNLEAAEKEKSGAYFFDRLYNFKPPPIPDIVTFAEDPLYLAKPPLYPRQKTILRLIFLDTENMTAYDEAVINQWRRDFQAGMRGGDRFGVPPDVWDRVAELQRQGRPHFREVEAIIGRRGGKGHLGAIMGSYQTYKLLMHDSPQQHYGIDPGKDLYLFATSVNFTRARDDIFADLLMSVTSGPCFENFVSTSKAYLLSFRTKADMRKILDYKRRGITMEREIASVKAAAVSTNSRATRGPAVFMLMLDEFAHLQETEGPFASHEVYRAATPALDQMGMDGLIFVPTSPKQKVGKAWELYVDTLKGLENYLADHPEMLVVQLASWHVYEDFRGPVALTKTVEFETAPQEYNDQMRSLEERDYEDFKVERKAQWAEVVDAYLSAEKVEATFDPFCPRCGQPTMEEECFRCELPIESMRLVPQNNGILRWVYRGHIDPSDVGHNMAFAIGHTQPFVNPIDGETYQHVIADYFHVWKPGDYDDHQIPYDQTEKEVAEVVMRFPNMKVLSYDQYGGFVTVPNMKRRLRKTRHGVRVIQHTHTVKEKKERWERFKAAIGMGWVHSFRDNFGDEGTSLLEAEAKFLQRKANTISAPTIGPVTTDDLVTAWSVVVSELLADQIDRFLRRERLGESTLHAGARGGYSSKMEPPPVRRSSKERGAREALQQFSRGKTRSRAPWSGPGPG